MRIQNQLLSLLAVLFVSHPAIAAKKADCGPELSSRESVAGPQKYLKPYPPAPRKTGLVDLTKPGRPDARFRGIVGPSPGFAGPTPGMADRAPVAPAPGASREELLKLARPVKTSLGESPVVKMVYEVSKNQVHLVNTKKYEYHYYYATAELGYERSNEEFNKNYEGPISRRQFVLGSFVFLPDENGKPSNNAVFEIWSGDDLDAVGLKQVIADVKKSVAKNIHVRFHPLSVDQEKVAKDGMDRADYILTTEIIGDRPYVAANPGEAMGYVKFITNGNDTSYDLRHIAVFDRVPNEFGFAAGAVTGEPQTPLSHVNVKSINRGTLNMYLKNARQLLAKYEGKPVHITAGANGYEITEIKDANPDEVIASFWRKRQPQLQERPVAENDPRFDHKLVPLHAFYKKLPSGAQHKKLIRLVGAKAASLALLGQIDREYKSSNKAQGQSVAPVSTPKGLGVQFSWFEQFMAQKLPGQKATLQDQVIALLDKGRLLDNKILHPAETSAPILNQVRALMASAQVPKELLELFRQAIFEDESSPIHISRKIPRIRLRSSTNSEDLLGFSGAGLYDSDGVNLFKKDKKNGGYTTEARTWEKIEEDLKELIPRLFSGIWNDRAYQEREWFGLNGKIHLDVKAALAVHGAFPAKTFGGEVYERANFVAVTTNLANTADYAKISFNAQHFDLAVTNPPLPEDFKAYGEDPSKPYSIDDYVVTTFTSDDIDSLKDDAYKRWPVERVRATSIQGGEPVMSHEEVREASRFIRFINDRMVVVYGFPADQFPIDLEGKIVGPQRVIEVKQARPFTPPK